MGVIKGDARSLDYGFHRDGRGITVGFQFKLSLLGFYRIFLLSSQTLKMAGQESC